MRAAITRITAAAALMVAAVTPGGLPDALGRDAVADSRVSAAAPGLPVGYWMYAKDGGVFAFGGAPFAGQVPNQGNDVVGMAATPTGAGYWVVDDDGDVFPAGDAIDFGSRPGDIDEVAAFAARPQGDGYWMATRTGGVEAYGGAPNLGSTAVRRSHRIVGLTATPSGGGYWTTGIDGGVFAFGDAAFYGSMGATRLNQPVVGMAATPTGRGYWLVAADGGLFSFGDAAFFGSMGGIPLNQPVVGMASSPTGNGYWLVAADGGLFAFGDARFAGSMGGTRLNQPMAGMLSAPGASGPGIDTASGPGSPTSPGVPAPPPSGPPPSGPPATTPPVVRPATLVGAGDIANCSASGDEATAKLLDATVAANPDAVVFTLGDNVYSNGTDVQFNDCYKPTWGRHRDRTRPAPGNHDYNTSGANGYYKYFGALAGDPKKGYYSYDLGAWHVIVLNSNCSAVPCAAGSAQDQWLRADLAASAARCTVAYWHHARFSSGSSHGSNAVTAPFWKALYEGGAELVLSGHEHLYERFAPQTPAGVADPAFGIRQFTAGQGGSSHYGFGTVLPTSERRDSTSFGVLKLSLRADGYDWNYLPIAGKTFTDSGSGGCHGRPGA